MNKRGSLLKLSVFLIVLIILGTATYFTFFFKYKCEDSACFVAHQETCSKTKFVNDLTDTRWEYIIEGKENGKCDIRIKVLEIKQGDLDRRKLEGKAMICSLSIGSKVDPQSDISKCTGPLKEEMQNMIIQKLHKYILDNVGEIGAEFKGIVPVVNETNSSL